MEEQPQQEQTFSRGEVEEAFQACRISALELSGQRMVLLEQRDELERKLKELDRSIQRMEGAALGFSQLLNPTSIERE